MQGKPIRAVTEWERYAENLTERRQVIFELSPDDSLGNDGYAIVSDDVSTTVTSPAARGLLYGAYALIDACRQAGGRLTATNARETPDFALRMLWSWSRLDDTYLHSPYRELPSVLSHINMENPEANAEIMRFARHMASMRVNALTLTYDLHISGHPSLDQHIYRPFYAKLDKFSRFLQEWGVDLYLYTSAAPERDFNRGGKRTDCPYDPLIRGFWNDYITEICENLPELGGLHIGGSLGGAAGGLLYDCECQYCRGKTPVEKIEEQIRLIAGLLKRHDKRLLYDLTTDGPVLLHREVEITLALADRLPDNAILTFKNHFQDFEELRYPEHPLFSRLEENISDHDIIYGAPGSRSLPVAAQMQLFGEMRGKGLILSNVTEIWRDEISRLHALGSKCIIGVVETHPDDAHPSMAEWYAWGRLAWDSGQQPNMLLAEWTRMNYPAGVEAILPDLLRGSYMAASNTIYAGGLQCAAHGMLCPSPKFLKHAMNETWYRGDRPAPFDILGVDDEPLHLYTDKRRNEIMNNPRMFLLTGAYKVSTDVYECLMREKDAAAAQYTALLTRWRTAEPLFKNGDYRYRAMYEMLEKNVEDAKRFRACLSVFWRYHMGALTERDIDEARSVLLSPHAPCSINTCDESVADFLEQIRMMLLCIPFDIYFNNMTSLPQINIPGWEEGQVRNGYVGE